MQQQQRQATINLVLPALPVNAIIHQLNSNKQQPNQQKQKEKMKPELSPFNNLKLPKKIYKKNGKAFLGLVPYWLYHYFLFQLHLV